MFEPEYTTVAAPIWVLVFLYARQQDNDYIQIVAVLWIILSIAKRAIEDLML